MMPTMEKTTMWTVMDSPVGEIRIQARDGAIARIEFSPYAELPLGQPLGERDDDDPLLQRAVEQLTAYFAGMLREFDLPLAPHGTAFQQLVWEQLRLIGYGETTSYGAIAAQLGRTTT